MTMRYYEIAEARHRIQNPFSEPKLVLLGEICGLRPGIRQLDLACGQGEMLCRWAQAHGITGVGVDISPVYIDIARRRAEELGVTSQVAFVIGDAGAYPAEPHAFDVVSCIGATWIGGGTLGTLDLMRKALKDDGLLLVGEVYWREDPSDAACETLGFKREDLVDLGGMPGVFDRAGVELVEMLISSPEEWDRYEAKKWMRVHQWLREHPDDPDAESLKRWMDTNQRAYLQYERRYLGWGVFVLKVKP